MSIELPCCALQNAQSCALLSPKESVSRYLESILVPSVRYRCFLTLQSRLCSEPRTGASPPPSTLRKHNGLLFLITGRCILAPPMRLPYARFVRIDACPPSPPPSSRSYPTLLLRGGSFSGATLAPGFRRNAFLSIPSRVSGGSRRLHRMMIEERSK